MAATGDTPERLLSGAQSKQRTFRTASRPVGFAPQRRTFTVKLDILESTRSLRRDEKSLPEGEKTSRAVFSCLSVRPHLGG